MQYIIQQKCTRLLLQVSVRNAAADVYVSRTFRDDDDDDDNAKPQHPTWFFERETIREYNVITIFIRMIRTVYPWYDERGCRLCANSRRKRASYHGKMCRLWGRPRVTWTSAIDSSVSTTFFLIDLLESIVVYKF